MNIGAITGAILTALFTSSTTFKVANKFQVTVTLANGGTPVHLTFAAALLAIEKILAGSAGTFQSGDILVSITEV